ASRRRHTRSKRDWSSDVCSSDLKAWSNSFFYKGLERVPTYKDELSALMEEYRGHIIATTACVGGELPQKSIKYHNEKSLENKQDIHNLIVWLKGTFGED